MSVQIRIGKCTDNRLAVTFPYDPNSIAKIKTMAGYKWHSKEKYWSIPSIAGNLDRLVLIFEGEKIEVDPKLYLEPLRKEITARKYSQKTIKAYLYYNECLLNFTKKEPRNITNEDIRNYLVHLTEVNDVSASTLNVVINALKFYYGEVLAREFIYEIKRPKKDKKLPVVLSREEVSRLLSTISNLKHKAILMFIYSAGLRVSEVVKLRLEDIDTQRKLIHLKGAKGRKDRYTLLSEAAMAALVKYLTEHEHSKWLFPGQNREKHITTRTVEKIFSIACKAANIHKPVTVHCLRHSFATHLLESGVDLRYIQEILGHKSSKTTEIYTHVTNRDLGKIRNPLDTIMEGGSTKVKISEPCSPTPLKMKEIRTKYGYE